MTDDLTKCDRLRLYAAAGMSSYTRLDPEDVRELSAARHASARVAGVDEPLLRRLSFRDTCCFVAGLLLIGFATGVLFCTLVEALR